MKRIISILLCVLFIGLTFCACGSKETQLTVDNYKDYLNVDIKVSVSGSADDSVLASGAILKDGSRFSGSAFTKLAYWGEVSGASSNFNYNDVKIKVKISGTYEGMKNMKDYPFTDYQSIGDVPFEYEAEISTDISGSGKLETVYVDIPDDVCTDGNLIKSEVEIIEISGTVSPA